MWNGEAGKAGGCLDEEEEEDGDVNDAEDDGGETGTANGILWRGEEITGLFGV